MQGPKLNVPFEASASNVLYGFTFINHGTIEDFKERMSLSMVARAVPCPSPTRLLGFLRRCFFVSLLDNVGGSVCAYTQMMEQIA